MIRLVLVGLWVLAVTIAAVHAGMAWRTPTGAAAADPYMPGLDYVKTEPISVPVIADGAVAGYVVAQLVYTVDAEIKRKLPVPLDVFLLDEAFRTIFADERIDFRHLERYDLGELTAAIAANVNARFTVALVREVLIGQVNFVSIEEVRNKMLSAH